MSKIKLIHGECIETMSKMKDGYFDMILCDPPYGTTACKWDTIIPLEPMWEQLKRITKTESAIVMTASQPFTSVLGASNIRDMQYSWTWIKSRATGHLNAKKRPMKQTEDVLVFYKKQPTYNPQDLVYSPRKVHNSKSHSLRGKDNKTSTVSGGIKFEEYTQEYTNYPKDIINIANEGSTVHPTQKPVALMEYLIKTYTNEGDTVLDFTMGSGTTGVACVNTNRNFIGIELDEKYFKIAEERINKALSDKETI